MQGKIICIFLPSIRRQYINSPRHSSFFTQALSHLLMLPTSILEMGLRPSTGTHVVSMCAVNDGIISTCIFIFCRSQRSRKSLPRYSFPRLCPMDEPVMVYTPLFFVDSMVRLRLKSHRSNLSFVWNCMMLLVPENANVRSSHCGSWTTSGASAPQVMVRAQVGLAVSSRPTSPMKSSMAASADEEMVGTNAAFIVEDQLPPERSK